MTAPNVETNPDIDPADPTGDFINRVADKFEKADAAREAKENGEGEDEGEDEGTDTGDGGNDSDDDDSGDEPADSDQADDDRDGDADDSDEDSSDQADDDEPTDEEDDTDSEDSDDDADADDDAEDETDDDEEEEEDEGEEDDDDGAVTEDFADAARRSDIPITLEDIPEGKPRQMVARRLREMESGFTRMAQSLNAYRKEQVQFKAEAKFRHDNPELFIVEAIDKLTEDQYKVVNERLQKLGDPDAKEVFQQMMEGRRSKAAKAVEEELSSGDRVAQRVHHVETLTMKLATKSGLPWSYAEKAIETAILRLPEGKRDLTDEEIAHVVDVEARQYQTHVRGERRGQSKQRVKDRTASRRTASRPGARTPTGAASPRPGGQRTPKVNNNSEESRQDAMMVTARRLFKGARDK